MANNFKNLFTLQFCKSNSNITLDHLCNFLFKQLYSVQHSVRLSAVHSLRQLTPHFVADDIELNEKQSESLDASTTICKWHFLNRFEDYLTRYDALITKYLEEFTFKLSELDDLEPIDRHNALSYLFLWDCIINACAKSPVALRAVYTNWLNDNKYEEVGNDTLNLLIILNLHFQFLCSTEFPSLPFPRNARGHT